MIMEFETLVQAAGSSISESDVLDLFEMKLPARITNLMYPFPKTFRKAVKKANKAIEHLQRGSYQRPKIRKEEIAWDFIPPKSFKTKGKEDLDKRNGEDKHA